MRDDSKQGEYCSERAETIVMPSTTALELRATLVIVMLLNEMSVKSGAAPRVDEDDTLDRKAGAMPLDVADGDTGSRLITSIGTPDPVHNWRR